MSQNIPQVQNTGAIKSAEFVKLTIFNEFSNSANVTTHTFSSAYRNETIDGDEYLALGGLLSVGSQNRDLRVTAGDTNISLSGVSGNNIQIVLDTKIRGSEVEVWRGFYDDNDLLGDSYLRFTGVITNYSVQEERTDNNDNFIVTVSASSYKTVLSNRIAGRKTNEESWKVFDPLDTSMDNVYSIAGVQFDFGKEVTASSGGRGRGGGGGGGGGGGDQRRQEQR